ncbi:MAG: LemA family protein [Steroidobacteraceae bacterium]
MAWIIVPVLAALAATAASGAFAVRRGLFRLQSDVDLAWREFAQQLRKRQEFVTAVTALCSRLMRHEQQTLERVIESGRAMMAAVERADIPALAGAEKAQHAAVAMLIDQAGVYPQFARSRAFGALVGRLATLDGRVAERRERYNAAAGLLNLRRNAFPNRWVADLSGYARVEFLVQI